VYIFREDALSDEKTAATEHHSGKAVFSLIIIAESYPFCTNIAGVFAGSA